MSECEAPDFCKHRFDQIDYAIIGLTDQLTVIDKAIRGNGTPGLNTRVHDLEKDAARHDKWFWWRVGILAACVASCIGSVVAAFVLASIT
jgi:hypothetical protein